MKALTITQPWASLIASGQKLVENRTWKPSGEMIGAQFAIHAGRKLDLEVLNELFHGMCGYDHKQFPYARGKDFPLGGVIAVATLSYCVWGDGTYQPAEDEDGFSEEPWRSLPVAQHRWYFGPVGFVLRDVVAIECVPCKGALGFWTLPDDAEAAVVSQLATAMTPRPSLLEMG